MPTFSRRTTLLSGAATAAVATGCALAVAFPAGAHGDAGAAAKPPATQSAKTVRAAQVAHVSPVAHTAQAKPAAQAVRKAATVQAKPAPNARNAVRAAAPAKAAQPVQARTVSVVTKSSDLSGLSPQEIAAQLVPAGQLAAFDEIISHESGWNVNATNASTGAYGLGQALPGSKMASSGSDWQSSAATQIKWALSYMDSRYGSPDAAWSFWQAHNWY